MSHNRTIQADKSSVRDASCLEVWPKTAETYSQLISNQSQDSHYLRLRGLKPNLLRMIGDCSEKRLLDIGCSNGWLLDEVKPCEGYSCDIVGQPDIQSKWKFQVQDIRSLSYLDNFFDVTVASLVLIWFEELDLAIKQMYRVTKPGGKAVIAMVHPYFYRVGNADDNSNFLISKDLSKPFKIQNLKIGGVAGPLTYFYRPFTDYLNTCIRTGFRINQVLDWFIDMEDYAQNTKNGMNSNITRSGKVPMYSFIECLKE
ncbi:MAG: class I SAM-dependent methyltransferase [Planctomycetes bacterium]|nr:class I SAM-dependent methyltransferase [Planctomycetota bacterium]